MSNVPAVHVFNVRIDEHRDLERDRRALEWVLRIYDRVADNLCHEIERLERSDGSFETKDIDAQMAKLDKSLASAIEIQGRIRKRVAALAEEGGDGGIDFDKARDEVRRRLDRLAERVREDGFS